MKRPSAANQLLTLQEHLLELRGRFFWTLAWVITASASGYLIKDYLISFFMEPLHGASLVYLTPIGGFNFIFRICLYFGLVVAVPVAMYQLFKFLQPLMRQKRSVVVFLLFSIVLALAGGLFAYYASMPAALNFLLNFDIQQVKAMLTVESYLSFVVTYVLGFAVLFQIPLLLLMGNSIRPTPPGKLMGLQRYVVVGAFVIAAIISPTPDATNQLILAAPVIAMYELGVLLVWLQNRMHRPAKDARVNPLTAKPSAHLTGTQSPGARPVPAPALITTPSGSRQKRTAPVTGMAISSKSGTLPKRIPAAMDIAPRQPRARIPGRAIVPREAMRPAAPRRPQPTVLRPAAASVAPPIRFGSIDGMRSSAQTARS